MYHCRIQIGKSNKIVPRPPLVSFRRPALPSPERIPSSVAPSPALSTDDQQAACPICLTNGKDLAFNCGHIEPDEEEEEEQEKSNGEKADEDLKVARVFKLVEEMQAMKPVDRKAKCMDVMAPLNVGTKPCFEQS